MVRPGKIQCLQPDHRPSLKKHPSVSFREGFNSPMELLIYKSRISMKIVVDLVKNPFFQMVWKRNPERFSKKGPFSQVCHPIPPLFLGLVVPLCLGSHFGILKQVTRRFQHAKTAAPAKTPPIFRRCFFCENFTVPKTRGEIDHHRYITTKQTHQICPGSPKTIE